MTNFAVQGVVLSNVACHNERRRTAMKLNKPVEEVPLKYGSVRIAVNLFQIDGVTYRVNKDSNTPDIRENRLILEISYRFDGEGNVIEDHEVVQDLVVGEKFDLHMTHSFISKNHHMKLINPGSGTIRSYFIKSWGDDIDFLDTANLTADIGKSIEPLNVANTFNRDQNLLLV